MPILFQKTQGCGKDGLNLVGNALKSIGWVGAEPLISGVLSYVELLKMS